MAKRPKPKKHKGININPRPKGLGLPTSSWWAAARTCAEFDAALARELPRMKQAHEPMIVSKVAE